MKSARILLPIAVSLYLLAGTGCMSMPGPPCGNPKVSAPPNTSVEIQNPCGPVWTDHDEFVVQSDGISVKTIVDADGGVTRQLVIGPNWQPSDSEIPVFFEYVAENGAVTGGAFYLIILSPLQVSVTATPPTIAPGQTTQLNATVTGGTPPYSYLWSPGAPLITNVTIPNPTAAPKDTTTMTVKITDYMGRYTSGMTTVTVTSVNPPPTIAGLTPTTGLVDGGTFVTISGDGFLAGATVRFGAVQAQDGSVVVKDSKTITAVTAPGVGTVDLTVTNPDGQSATFPMAFTYYKPLVITSITATPAVVTQGGSSQLLVSASGGIPFTSGSPYLYQWRNDPGLSNLTVANPIATPPGTSAYNLTVTDSINNTVSGSVTVTRSSATLAACFHVPDVTITHGVPLTLDGRCSTGPNPLVLFEWWSNWNAANPAPPDLSGPFLVQPTFTYAAAGKATVRLQVTDSTGATSATTTSITVH